MINGNRAAAASYAFLIGHQKGLTDLAQAIACVRVCLSSSLFLSLPLESNYAAKYATNFDNLQFAASEENNNKTQQQQQAR